jgi:hypothetical protein
VVAVSLLVENTGSFAQFQFESFGIIEQRKRRKLLTTPKPRDFDDIWDLL